MPKSSAQKKNISKARTSIAGLPWWKRRQPMRAFFGVLMVVGFLLMAYPFLPLLQYSIAPQSVEDLPYRTKLSREAQAALSLPAPGDKTPEGNRLVIPSIGVDMQVVEGESESALLYGAWRIPGTSDTPTQGNLVLSGHRFRYRPPATETLYLLDRVRTGDTIILYWQGEEYDYTISETRIVDANAVEILEPTTQPQLTVFTCTPLFSTKQRLVVTALPID